MFLVENLRCYLGNVTKQPINVIFRQISLSYDDIINGENCQRHEMQKEKHICHFPIINKRLGLCSLGKCRPPTNVEGFALFRLA